MHSLWFQLAVCCVRKSAIEVSARAAKLQQLDKRSDRRLCGTRRLGDEGLDPSFGKEAVHDGNLDSV